MNTQKRVFGIGINDAPKPFDYSCPIYKKWVSMLSRCYSEKYLSRMPSYVGCSVDERWKIFSGFCSWASQYEMVGTCLDKDLICPGNKIYSPETCAIVSESVNNFLTGCVRQTKDLPIGVSRGLDGRISVRCSNPFTRKNEFLGYFNCELVAHKAWKARKHQHACRYADMQTDSRIAEALRSRFA